jgi:hypothetical protein
MILDNETLNIIRSFKADVRNDSNLNHYAICRYIISGNNTGAFEDIFGNSVSGDSVTTYRDVIVRGMFAERESIYTSTGGIGRNYVPGGYTEVSDATFVTDYSSGFILRECSELWARHTFNVNPPNSGNCGDIKYILPTNYTSGLINGGYCYTVKRVENAALIMDVVGYLKLKEQ